MAVRLAILFSFVLITRISFCQGIRDSVFHINDVKVTANQLFNKENAGNKQTRVDSMVLINQINHSVSDVLAENTNVFIKDYGRGALATASFRGTAPTHTQVSWNGIAINSPMLGMVDFSLLPVYIADEMSLQHGAASVSTSSGGLGGHIDISNSVNWNNKLSGRYIQGIGSFSTFDEFGQLNFGNKTFQSKSRVYHNYSKNNYLYTNKQIANINTETHEITYPTERLANAGFAKYGAMQELYLHPTPNLFTDIKLWYQHAERAIPMVSSYEGNDSSRRENNQINTTFKGVTETKWYHNQFTYRVLSGIDHQQLNYYSFSENPGSGRHTAVYSESDMLTWQSRAQIKYVANERISSQIRMDATYYNIATLDTVSELGGYEKERFDYSLFAGLYVNVLQPLNVLLELRKDFIPDIASPFIYNIGLAYKPFNDHNLVLKAGHARNFRHPTLNDLYWQPGGNPDLKPEQGTTTEAGMHYKYETNTTGVEVQVTSYYSDIQDWILWLPDLKGYWKASNLQQVISQGIELNVKYSRTWGGLTTSLQGNYAFTSTVNQRTPIGHADGAVGSQLPFIPKHSGNVFGQVSWKKYFVNFQNHNYGVRHLIASNLVSPDNGFPFYRVYAQHLNHASVGRYFNFNSFKGKLEFKVRNLLNEEYRSVLNRMMPGRNYTLLMMINF